MEQRHHNILVNSVGLVVYFIKLQPTISMLCATLWQLFVFQSRLYICSLVDKPVKERSVVVQFVNFKYVINQISEYQGFTVSHMSMQYEFEYSKFVIWI